MKIQLDYTSKVITLESNVNMGEFFEKIKTILPEWADWKLDTKNVINFQSPPVVIERPYVPFQPYPYVTYCGTSTDTQLISI